MSSFSSNSKGQAIEQPGVSKLAMDVTAWIMNVSSSVLISECLDEVADGEGSIKKIADALIALLAQQAQLKSQGLQVSLNSLP